MDDVTSVGQNHPAADELVPEDNQICVPSPGLEIQNRFQILSDEEDESLPPGVEAIPTPESVIATIHAQKAEDHPENVISDKENESVSPNCTEFSSGSSCHSIRPQEIFPDPAVAHIWGTSRETTEDEIAAHIGSIGCDHSRFRIERRTKLCPGGRSIWYFAILSSARTLQLLGSHWHLLPKKWKLRQYPSQRANNRVSAPTYPETGNMSFLWKGHRPPKPPIYQEHSVGHHNTVPLQIQQIHPALALGHHNTVPLQIHHIHPALALERAHT